VRIEEYEFHILIKQRRRTEREERIESLRSLRLRGAIIASDALDV